MLRDRMRAFSQSDAIQAHCETTEFDRCPTGGQVVAGSNPVSPTQLRSLGPVVILHYEDGSSNINLTRECDVAWMLRDRETFVERPSAVWDESGQPVLEPAPARWHQLLAPLMGPRATEPLVP